METEIEYSKESSVFLGFRAGEVDGVTALQRFG